MVHPFLGTTCALHDSFLHFAPSPRRGSIYGPARYGQIEKERALEAERLQTPRSGTAAQQLKSLRQSATYKLGRRLVV